MRCAFFIAHPDSRIPNAIQIRRTTMKTTLRNIVMTLGLTAVLGNGTLLARDFNRSTATIPFEFQIKKTTLPPGRYNVSYTPATKLLVFRNEGNGGSAMLLVNQLKAGGAMERKLVFQFDSESYTMDEVWFDGGVYGPGNRKHDRRDSERGMAASVRLISK